jgi:hypothetical protein
MISIVYTFSDLDWLQQIVCIIGFPCSAPDILISLTIITNGLRLATCSHTTVMEEMPISFQLYTDLSLATDLQDAPLLILNYHGRPVSGK